MKHIIGIFILMIGLFVGCTKEDTDSIDKAKTSVTPATANLNIEVKGPDETKLTILLEGRNSVGEKRYKTSQNGILKENSSYGKSYIFEDLDTSLTYKFHLTDSVPGAVQWSDSVYTSIRLKAGDNEREVEVLSKVVIEKGDFVLYVRNLTSNSSLKIVSINVYSNGASLQGVQFNDLDSTYQSHKFLGLETKKSCFVTIHYNSFDEDTVQISLLPNTSVNVYRDLK